MKKKKPQYTAVIIGTGNIGSGFDTPKSKHILTHAHAYLDNSRVLLKGVYDKKSTTARAAARKWGTHAYDTLDALMSTVQPDIVSVCTPDVDHFSTLKKIATYTPRVVICEKPITTSVAESKHIIALYKKSNIALVINYSRRFDVSIQNLQKDIQKNTYGNIQSARAIYTKGILHNGSHIIDMSRYLFGEVKKSSTLSSINDYSVKDKTVSAYITFQKCPHFILTGVDDTQYPIVELDILFEQARFRYFDFGFQAEIQKVGGDPLFKGYRSLQKSKKITTGLEKALPVLVKNTVDFLDGKSTLVSTAKEAFRTQKVCMQLVTT